MLSFPNAKINLGLHVTHKRSDGYHDLETVFYPVSVKDALEINDAERTAFRLEGIAIPGNAEDDICIRAIELLSKDHQLMPQQVTLLKHIPVGAGLGGGSADAAFLIKMLNTRFNLGLSDDQMERYARKLGADCAFFIRNKPVYAFGKGDQFKPAVIDLSGYNIVLVKPPVAVSTRDAFEGIIPKMPLRSLESLMKLPVPEWSGNLINDFEQPVFLKYPEIKELKELLYHKGAIFAQMSGSGSSVFGIFNQQVTLDLPPAYTVFYNS